MNRLLRAGLAAAFRGAHRLKEKAGLVHGFSGMEMHLWMLADDVRADAFEQAIDRAVTPGSVVVDVGAGTGLLSLMACRAGAERVYAIEESPILDVALDVARDNGFGGRIVPVRMRSTKANLPERADVVVSETIGAFVFSEEIVSTLADARARFLKPGGVLIPRSIRIFLAPFESFEEGVGLLERALRGFDFRAAARRVPVQTMMTARRLRPDHFLDLPRSLYDLDFTSANNEPDFSRTLEFAACRDGVLHGLAGLWEARLDERVLLRCAPDAPPLHWAPVLFRLPAGCPVRSGETIRVRFGRRDAPGWSWKWEAEVAGRA